jgi:hypothetical protein
MSGLNYRIAFFLFGCLPVSIKKRIKINHDRVFIGTLWAHTFAYWNRVLCRGEEQNKEKNWEVNLHIESALIVKNMLGYFAFSLSLWSIHKKNKKYIVCNSSWKKIEKVNIKQMLYKYKEQIKKTLDARSSVKLDDSKVNWILI